MKKIQILVKNAVIKIRDTASTAIKFIGNASIKQKVILGSSLGGSVLLIIGGLVVFNLHNSKTGQDEVITLTASDGSTSTITASQIANAESTRGTSPDAVDYSTTTIGAATSTVVPAVVPDGHGGVTANPAITDSKQAPTTEGQSQPTTSSQQSTPKQSGSTQQASTPNQSQPAQTQTQQPSTPSRMSGAEMTNYIMSKISAGYTNNTNIGSGSEVCTSPFLANAISIINSYNSGGMDAGSAKSRLQSLNMTGDTTDNFGRTVITRVISTTAFEFSKPGSSSVDDITLATNRARSGCTVYNVNVIYNSSNDTYLIRGAGASTQIGVKR